MFSCSRASSNSSCGGTDVHDGRSGRGAVDGRNPARKVGSEVSGWPGGGSGCPGLGWKIARSHRCFGANEEAVMMWPSGVGKDGVFGRTAAGGRCLGMVDGPGGNGYGDDRSCGLPAAGIDAR